MIPLFDGFRSCEQSVAIDAGDVNHAHRVPIARRDLRVGQAAHVMLDASPWRRWPARVHSVAAQPSSLVAESVLVQAHGGLIDAREAHGGWVPHQSLYRVTLTLDEPPALAARAWRGHAAIAEAPQSLAERLWRRVSAAWVREAGF